MFIIWDEEALGEANAATEFYHQKQANLGQRFVDTLEEATTRIAQGPLMPPKIETDLRKCKLPYFPYSVIYRVQGDTLQIIAIMHIRREPGYWKHRIGT